MSLSSRQSLSPTPVKPSALRRVEPTAPCLGHADPGAGAVLVTGGPRLAEHRRPGFDVDHRDSVRIEDPNEGDTVVRGGLNDLTARRVDKPDAEVFRSHPDLNEGTVRPLMNRDVVRFCPQRHPAVNRGAGRALGLVEPRRGARRIAGVPHIVGVRRRRARARRGAGASEIVPGGRRIVAVGRGDAEVHERTVGTAQFNPVLRPARTVSSDGVEHFPVARVLQCTFAEDGCADAHRVGVLAVAGVAIDRRHVRVVDPSDRTRRRAALDVERIAPGRRGWRRRVGRGSGVRRRRVPRLVGQGDIPGSRVIARIHDLDLHQIASNHERDEGRPRRVFRVQRVHGNGRVLSRATENACRDGLDGAVHIRHVPDDRVWRRRDVLACGRDDQNRRSHVACGGIGVPATARVLVGEAVAVVVVPVAGHFGDGADLVLDSQPRAVVARLDLRLAVPTELAGIVHLDLVVRADDVRRAGVGARGVVLVAVVDAGVLPVVAASSEGEGDGQGGQGLERGHGTLLCCGVVRGFLPLGTIPKKHILFNFQ